jgi:hypothetical protein
MLLVRIISRGTRDTVEYLAGDMKYEESVSQRAQRTPRRVRIRAGLELWKIPLPLGEPGGLCEKFLIVLSPRRLLGIDELDANP